MTEFCALCTSDVGPFVKQPFGRKAALVLVCNDCDTLHPITGRYSFDDAPKAARCDTTHQRQTRIAPKPTGSHR